MTYDSDRFLAGLLQMITLIGSYFLPLALEEIDATITT